MIRFHKVDEGVAITLSKGTYRQVQLYRRGENLYAANGGGFIKLIRGGGTSNPNVSWHEIDAGPSGQFIETTKDLSVKFFAMGQVIEAAE